MIAYGGRERLVEDVDHGDHLCLMFADDAEQQRVATSYVLGGFRRAERVLYFADQNTPAQILRWLRAAGVDPIPALDSGQLVVTTADDSYLAEGTFDAEAMVATVRKETADSLAAGFTGLRVSGEMCWALRGIPGSEQLSDYEMKVNEVFAGHRASAICQYDVRRFDAVGLQGFDRCHSGAVELEPLYQDGALKLVPAFRHGQRALRVIGKVDYRTTEALAHALETVVGWSADVWVDMSGLEFIDVAGLRALAHAAQRLPEGRRMHVVELAPLLSEVISLAGFDDIPALTVSAWEADE